MCAADGKEGSTKLRRHPLLIANVPPLPQMQIMQLKVPGYDGYTLTTITQGDDVALRDLLTNYLNSGVPVRKQYDPKAVSDWFDHTLYFTNLVLPLATKEQRNAALFDTSNSYQKAIPLQIIRYNGQLIGHCALKPGQRGQDLDHPSGRKNFVKLNCMLTPISQEHLQKGVLFTACQELLREAAKSYDVDLVYASTQPVHTKVKDLLQKLMEWSKEEWGGNSDSGDTSFEIKENASPSTRQEMQKQRNVVPRHRCWWLWQIGHREKKDEWKMDKEKNEKGNRDHAPLHEADQFHQDLISAMYGGF
ncbi:hypothetical protein BDZ45DRAFT_730282 [Acephala macrosclerotiorum]|nr:hypothetical protein BDZ45DRAFT_730282 [Acephala macrosclerotiorum]